MKIKSILLVIVLTVIISCAVNRATINTFTDPGFRIGKIKRIAVFPIKNTRFAPSEAQLINRKISSAIKKNNPSIEIIGPAESIRLLNANGLADDWGYFLDNYLVSGIPDATVLADIGRALNVDAVFQGEILQLFQEDGIPGDLFSKKGITRVTVSFSLMEIESGKLLWEATSDGVKGTVTSIEKAPPIIEAVDLALGKIMENLPQL